MNLTLDIWHFSFTKALENILCCELSAIATMLQKAQAAFRVNLTSTAISVYFNLCSADSICIVQDAFSRKLHFKHFLIGSL